VKLYDAVSRLLPAEVRSVVAADVVVDVTSVARMIDANFEGKVLIDDAPSALPPFPHLWMEWLPFVGFDGEGVIWRMSTRRLEGNIDARWDEFDATARRAIQFNTSEKGRPVAAQTFPGDPVWLVEGFIARVSERKRVGSVANTMMLLNERGQIVNARDGKYPAFAFWPAWDTGNAAQHGISMQLLMNSLNIGMFSIGLMHCKNVVVADGGMPPVKVARKQEKKLGAPLTKFKTLTIQPLKASNGNTEDTPVRVSSERIAHIVRGHFAYYSEEKPLFGKYSGPVWRQAHVRGSEKVGKMLKDYRVKV